MIKSPKKKPRRRVEIVKASYQPSKADMEEEFDSFLVWNRNFDKASEGGDLRRLVDDLVTDVRFLASEYLPNEVVKERYG